MNKALICCVLAATVSNAIHLESETEAPFVSINVGTPDNYDVSAEEPYVEINVGDVDAVGVQETQEPANPLTDEELSTIQSIMAPDYDFSAETDSAFIKWMYQNDKEYTTLYDYLEHLSEFLKDLQAQEENELDAESTQLIVTNKFSDRSDEELDILLSSGLDTEDSILQSSVPTILQVGVLPDYVNWVEAGKVSPVREQGFCGACWSFSGISTIESSYAIKYDISIDVPPNLLSLSVQQPVDCDANSKACSGGLLDNAAWYVLRNGGVDLDADYPYIEDRTVDPNCPVNRGPVRVTQVHRTDRGSEEQLMAAIAKGPTSVAVDSKSKYFRKYGGGVITSPDCGTKVDHAVVAVGYGTTDDGIDYYLIRNSWGPDWGDNGYVKIKRGPAEGAGTCGVQLIGGAWPETVEN